MTNGSSFDSAASQVLSAIHHMAEVSAEDAQYPALEVFTSVGEALACVELALGLFGKSENISEDGEDLLAASRMVLYQAAEKLKVLERNGLKL